MLGALFLCAALVSPGGARAAGEGALPPSVTAAFIFKILGFDRKLGARTGSAVSLVILFKPGEGASVSCEQKVGAAIGAMASKTQVASKKVTVQSLAYGPKFRQELAKLDANVLYLCDGLSDVLPVVTGVTQARSVLSFTGSEPEVKEGISVGIVRKDGRPSIVVNLSSSRAEGADLDSAVLQLAVVLR